MPRLSRMAGAGTYRDRKAANNVLEVGEHEVAVTHPDRVVFPDVAGGITKLDRSATTGRRGGALAVSPAGR